MIKPSTRETVGLCRSIGLCFLTVLAKSVKLGSRRDHLISRKEGLVIELTGFDEALDWRITNESLP
jgi:hypothetical protein